MNDNDLKKLKRADLLEILIAQGKEIERLENALEEAENNLRVRTIEIENLGSLAEASLKLNKVFEAADEAAKQYLDNVKVRCSQFEKSFKKSLQEDSKNKKG